MNAVLVVGVMLGVLTLCISIPGMLIDRSMRAKKRYAQCLRNIAHLERELGMRTTSTRYPISDRQYTQILGKKGLG